MRPCWSIRCAETSRCFPSSIRRRLRDYANALLQGAVPSAGRFVIYGPNGGVHFWRDWFEKRPELAGWSHRSLGPFKDVDAVVFERRPSTRYSLAPTAPDGRGSERRSGPAIWRLMDSGGGFIFVGIENPQLWPPGAAIFSTSATMKARGPGNTTREFRARRDRGAPLQRVPALHAGRRHYRSAVPRSIYRFAPVVGHQRKAVSQRRLYPEPAVVIDREPFSKRFVTPGKPRSKSCGGMFSEVV